MTATDRDRRVKSDSERVLYTSKIVQKKKSPIQDLRHGLIDGLHSVTHGKLVYNLLRGLLKVDLPCIVPFGVGDLHHTVVLDICHIVEEVLRRGKHERVSERPLRKKTQRKRSQRGKKIKQLKIEIVERLKVERKGLRNGPFIAASLIKYLFWEAQEDEKRVTTAV